MKKIADFIIEKRKIILIVFVLLTIYCGFLITQVSINYDMSKYLPDDSQTRIGMDIMNKQFSESSVLNVMLSGLSEEDKIKIRSELLAKDDVDSVAFEEQSEKYNKDGYTLYTINLNVGAYSSESRELVSDLNRQYADYKISISGEAAKNVSMDILPLLFGAALVILLIILFLMCNSWIEPLLFLLTIGVAIILNMGTNAIFDSVSDITMAIGAILQLVLSMDYSIMLLNRFRQEKQKTDNTIDAMKNAVRHSFTAISSSAVTTIVGMLALVFISFAIGKDLGLVLAKGVFFSLLCIFTVLPALILMCNTLIEKTAKKSLHIKMDKLGNFSYKHRIIIAIAFLLLFAGSFLLRDKVHIDYTMEKYNDVSKIFTPDNQMIVLYETKDENKIASLAQKISKDANTVSVNAYSTTLGKEMTYQELAQNTDMDETTAIMLYNAYFTQKDNTPKRKIALGPLLQFLQTDLTQNELFASMFDETAMAQLGPRIASIPPEMMMQEVSSEEFAAYTGLDITSSEMLFEYYDATQGDKPEGTIKIYDFIGFVSDYLAENEQFKPFIDDEMMAKLQSAKSDMDDGLKQLVGSEYSRLIITVSLPEESEETFAYIKNLEKELNDSSLGNHYLVGSSVIAYEMYESFPKEMNLITILTAIAIFLVVLIAFRSLSIPFILVCLIQCAIFITMSVLYLAGLSVYYLPLLIVQCLLMGATIDYGILFTSYYQEARQTLDKKESTITALNDAIHTIMTSGLILIMVTLVLGFLFASSQQAISEILLTISGGSVCSFVLVVFILPSIITTFDRFVSKKKSS